MSRSTITPNDVIGKMPGNELETSLEQFLEPLTALLPDARMPMVARLMVQGIVTSESPLVTQIARGTRQAGDTMLMSSKRGYRFLANERVSHRLFLKGLYSIAQRTVASQTPPLPRVVAALDPVNFEKPYTQALEGVSVVRKSTPPALDGEARLTHGYPAITATIVNTDQPATSYANWFSYTLDFISQNREVERAVRITRALFSGHILRFVTDSELDDQKFFALVARVHAEFVTRVKHPERLIEVYNVRTHAWDPTTLAAAAQRVFLEETRRVAFTHAGKTRILSLRFGRLEFRLPQTHQVLWALIVHSPAHDYDIRLITNVPLTSRRVMREVYEDWRLRGRVEHGYRFDQEQGLDVEDMRVQTLERMRRLFVLVLLAAQFVFFIDRTWPHDAILWLRDLGGRLGQPSDRDGPYVLLRGIASVWLAIATLRFLVHHPFPGGF
jgi:hypothetical protein